MTVVPLPAAEQSRMQISSTTPPPRVSVVMPIYNTRDYLIEAVESIRAQTFRDFELLLVDDGSTDDSLTIANQLATQDDRLRVLAFAHEGYRNINRAVEQARAPLVARMDSDDTALPERLALQYQYMVEHPECVAVGTWLEKTDPFGSPCGLQTPTTEHDEIVRLLLEANASGIINGTTMFRRDVWLKIGGIDTSVGYVEDLDLFLRLAEQGRLANIPKVLYRYRRHLGSTCYNHFDDMMNNIGRVMQSAWARRGLPGEPNLEIVRERCAHKMSVADICRSWACHAMEQRNVKLARYHAWQAVRREPMSLQSWRVLYWSMAA